YGGVTPSKPGYTFKPFESISVFEDTLIYASYVKDLVDVTLTIDGETVVYPYNTIVTLEANTGYHWEENGVVVSLCELFVFSAIYSRDLVQVEGTFEQPIITISSKLLFENRSGFESYVVKFEFSESYQFVEAGLIVSTQEIQNLTL